jgi:hypothetical protein
MGGKLDHRVGGVHSVSFGQGIGSRSLAGFTPSARASSTMLMSPDVAFAPLDATYVVSMQVRQLGQAFLRKTTLGPRLADA